MAAITRELADFVAGISYDALPGEVRERARWLVTDMVGIALRARHEAESTPALLAAVERLGLGQGKAAVIGDERGYSPPAAALALREGAMRWDHYVAQTDARRLASAGAWARARGGRARGLLT